MSQRPRILLVEDEAAIRKTVSKRLEVAGFDVLTAADGLEGLNAARTQRPDLIILDIMMPKMNGYEVCMLLKRDRDYEHIPIIFLTAKTHEGDRQEGMAQGADAYLTKPFKPEVLLDLIHTFLAKRPPAPTAGAPPTAA